MRQESIKRLKYLLFVTFGLLLWSEAASANPSVLSAWRTKYPNSDSDANAGGTGCALCHGSQSATSSYNSYGWAIREILPTPRPTTLQGLIAAYETAVINIQNLNSDSDPGVSSNLLEINSSTQPGWTVGPNNTIKTTSSTTTGQSPPPLVSSIDPTPQTFQLTVSPTPSNGRVTATGISCGNGGTGDCTESFNSGTNVTLTAIPVANFQVGTWTGCTPNNTQCTVSMTQARTVSVTFTPITPDTFQLTVSPTPSNGRVTATGISCGSGSTGDCTESFNSGTNVTLTATPVANFQIGTWTGCTPNNIQCTVSMTQARTVSVTFTPIPTFDYTLTNSGNVTVTQGGSGSNKITQTLVSGTTQAVSLSVSGLPSGATIQSLTNTPCSPTCTSALTIATTAATAAGNYQITVSGNPLSRTTTFTLIVNAQPFDYNLTNGGNIVVTQGGSGSNTITQTLVAGTTQAVSLKASGLPPGATMQGLTNSPCSPTCASTLTIATTAATAAGTHPITVSGSLLGKTTSFNLVVNAVGGELQFSQSGYTVSESGGNATITVTRTGGTTGRVTLAYATSNGSAVAGTHYRSVSGTLTFNAGQTSRTFRVPITNNTVVGGDKTINLTLSNPTGGAALGAQNTALLTMTDDDVGGSITFSAAAYNVRDRSASVRITVLRGGGAASGVSVAYATSNGTAVAGQDYTTASGTLTFGARVTRATFTVRILNHNLGAAQKTVNLSLFAAAGGASLGSPSAAVLTISGQLATLQTAANDLTNLQPQSSNAIDDDASGVAAEPIFALNEAELDLGPVPLGEQRSRPVKVHNLGDADLTVTGIERCADTSGSYSWSPNRFTITQDSSTTVTVFYRPTAATTEAGCLQFYTNDPSQNPVQLNVSGRGMTASRGAALDFDIERFNVSGNASLGTTPRVTVEVQVVNAGSVDGMAEVTVVGVQDRTEVYRKMVAVTLGIGRGQTVTFPAYIPARLGEINWKVSINDEDPDIDEAGGVTEVIQ